MSYYSVLRLLVVYTYFIQLDEVFLTLLLSKMKFSLTVNLPLGLWAEV